MRRPTMLVATALTLAVAAVAMLGLATLARPLPNPVNHRSGATEEIVRGFYAAVNAAIATGDPATIRDVVAADLIEHEPLPGKLAGREGLEDYLRTLHATSPDLRLTVATMVAADDRAIARVAVSGTPEPRFLGMAIDPPPPRWGPVEVFRVAGGKVVERWGATTGLVALRSTSEVPFAIAAATHMALRVERLTFDPGARIAEAAGQGPVLLHTDTGEFLVTPHAGADVRLATGEPLVLPASSRYTLMNVGHIRARTVIAKVIASIPSNQPWAILPLPSYPPGVTGELLAAGWLVPAPGGTASLAVERAALAPGCRIALPALGGPTAIIVTAGDLRLASAEPAWVRQDEADVLTTARETVLATGDSAYLVSPAALELGNAGDEPAEVLVVVLRPAPAEAPTPTLRQGGAGNGR